MYLLAYVLLLLMNEPIEAFDFNYSAAQVFVLKLIGDF